MLEAAAALPALALANTGTEVFENFWLDAFVDPQDLDYAIIKLQMPQGSWFGLGLGTSNMNPGSDMI